MHEQGRPIAVPMHDAPPTKRPLLRLDYCLGVGHPCTGLAVCWYGGAHATHAGPGRPDPRTATLAQYGSIPGVGAPGDDCRAACP